MLEPRGASRGRGARGGAEAQLRGDQVSSPTPTPTPTLPLPYPYPLTRTLTLTPALTPTLTSTAPRGCSAPRRVHPLAADAARRGSPEWPHHHRRTAPHRTTAHLPHRTPARYLPASRAQVLLFASADTLRCAPSLQRRWCPNCCTSRGAWRSSSSSRAVAAATVARRGPSPGPPRTPPLRHRHRATSGVCAPRRRPPGPIRQPVRAVCALVALESAVQRGVRAGPAFRLGEPARATRPPRRARGAACARWGACWASTAARDRPASPAPPRRGPPRAAGVGSSRRGPSLAPRKRSCSVPACGGLAALLASHLCSAPACSSLWPRRSAACWGAPRELRRRAQPRGRPGRAPPASCRTRPPPPPPRPPRRRATSSQVKPIEGAEGRRGRRRRARRSRRAASGRAVAARARELPDGGRARAAGAASGTLHTLLGALPRRRRTRWWSASARSSASACSPLLASAAGGAGSRTRQAAARPRLGRRPRLAPLGARLLRTRAEPGNKPNPERNQPDCDPDPDSDPRLT